ncbi:hypothetical protein [Thiomicrospira sp. WB1]|uniref:hypothetical protein n=1 Tax=Thiomicrospira sp. WB1 TaxID=1685380 RepID=UPI00074AF1E2|nr:hypothetical protein [Thiomicrospira sp. WB1]KUJ71242.1 hypothetical protein AVO41_10335 [Thiomicrospira sp. WB1]
MNLLDLPEEQRDHFSKSVQVLVQKHRIDPNEIFMNALESQEAPEMNYWMIKVLIQEHFVSPQQSVGQDAEGETVKPLQAAALLKNVGAVAALLEANAFQGSVTDKEFQLTARIASKQEDQAVLGVMMKYAQAMGHLETFMRELEGAPVH